MSMPVFGIIVYLAGAALLVSAVHAWRRDLTWGDGFLYAALATAFFARPLLTSAIQVPTDLAYEMRPWNETLPERVMARSPLTQDTLLEQLPFHTLVRRRLLAGEAPLWSHEMGTGQPLLGNAQSAPFAPLHLLALPLPPLRGLTVSAAWEMLLHLLLAHALARALGAARTGAALAAVAIGLSSHAVVWAYDAPGMSAAWVPGMLLGIVLLARGERGALPGLVACTVGLAVSGHPETLAHAALASLGVAAAVAVRMPWPRSRSFLLGLAAAAVMSAALAAPVLLPFVQALPASQRWAAIEEDGPDLLRPPPFEARYLLPVIDPLTFGGPFDSPSDGPLNFTEMCSDYAGVLTLALAVAGAVACRGRILAILLAGAGALLASLRVWPFFDLLNALPILQQAAHARLRGFWVLAVALAAGLALERIATSVRGRSWAVATALLAGVSLLLLTPASGAWGDAQRGLATVGLGAAVATLCVPRWRAAFRATAVAAVAADLFVLGVPFHPSMSPAYDLSPPQALAFLIQQERSSPTPFRVVAEESDLLPNLAAVYGLWDPRGNDPMRPADPLDLLGPRLQPSREVGQTLRALPGAFDAGLYDFLSVRFVLARRRRMLPPPWHPVFEGVGGRVWENPDALPLFFMPSRFARFATPGHALQASKGIADFAALGVASGAIGLAEPAITAQAGEVRGVRPRSNGFDLQVVSGGGTVVSSVSYDPAWHLEIDGRAAAGVLEVDSGFVGFAVPQGAHRVRLDYRPTGWSWGLVLCCLGLAASIASSLRDRHRRTAVAPPSEHRLPLPALEVPHAAFSPSR